MKYDELRSSFLEERYTVRIMVALRQKGQTTRQDLYETVSNGSSTVGGKVNTLISIGLVEEEVRKALPFTKHLRLTEKGTRVADLLVEIEKVVAN
ncbi:MAG: hypothetical protein WCK39_01750 [Methanomassiliicoccales archaeon]